ncbi:unnamed protein product, partial [marine sediment metagenome]
MHHTATTAVIAKHVIMQRVRNWWTPERVAYYLERYQGLRAHLADMGGSGFDCPDPERPFTVRQGAALRYEQAFVAVVGILADLDRAIESLPNQPGVRWRKMAHLYWRSGATQEKLGNIFHASQSVISRDLAAIVEVL